MSPEDALFHWGAKSNPWKLGKQTLRFPKAQSIDPDLIRLDRFGNVISMPPLVGVPCFGLPFPYLRHFHSWTWESAKKKKRPGRCRTCRFADACGKVVDARVSWNAELQKSAKTYVIARNKLSDAKIKWLMAKAGHRVQPSHQEGFDRASSKYRRANTLFRAELVKHHWINSNDSPGIARAYHETIAKSRAARKARKRHLREGKVPPEYVAALSRASARRTDQLLAYARLPGSDARIRKTPAESLRRDVRVWSSSVQLAWTGHGKTAYAIAKALGASDPDEINRHRQWIGQSLKRIARYEGEVMNGLKSPLWDGFDPEDWIVR